MKSKVVIVIITLSLVLAGGIAEQILVEKTFTEFGEKLEALPNEDGTFNLEKAEELHEWWSEKHEYMELTLSHVQLNEIEYNFGEMIGGIKAGDYVSATAMLQRIITSTHTMQEMNRLDAGNIF